MRDMVPSEFYLSQNYPDPFSRRTSIKFCLAYRTRVRLDVCNFESKILRRLIDEEREAGTYEIEFDAGGLKEGVYSYTLRAGAFKSTKQMVVKK